MKRSREEVNTRRARLALMIGQEGYLPIRELCQRMNISEATLRRDLSVLDQEQRITRTRGGALTDSHPRFPTYAQRRQSRWEEKQRLGRLALSLLTEGSTCYFDAGTTVSAVAEALVERPVPGLIVVTPSIPVAEILSNSPGIEVFIPGGQLFPRESVLLGDRAQDALQAWTFDTAILGVQAFNAAGLWNTREIVVRLQQAARARSRRCYYCADSSKCGEQGDIFLSNWSPRMELLTTTPPSRLRACAIPPGSVFK
ncbi:MAG: DeoR/GlpR family DNA-binding transcription regulator [Candidatus Methylacidiphilales bacterium]